MLHWVDYAKIFMSLIVVVNPISAVPIFVTLTARNTEKERKNIPRIASISVAVVLVLSAIMG